MKESFDGNQDDFRVRFYVFDRFTGLKHPAAKLFLPLVHSSGELMAESGSVLVAKTDYDIDTGYPTTVVRAFDSGNMDDFVRRYAVLY